MVTAAQSFMMTVVAVWLTLTSIVACSSNPPGDPAVYAEIRAATDCGPLEDRFDQTRLRLERAEVTGDQEQALLSLSYLEAIEERMGELGCR